MHDFFFKINTDIKNHSKYYLYTLIALNFFLHFLIQMKHFFLIITITYANCILVRQFRKILKEESETCLKSSHSYINREGSCYSSDFMINVKKVA